MNPFDPKQSTTSKSLSLGWWKEILARWIGFMKQGTKEVFALLTGGKR